MKITPNTATWYAAGGLFEHYKHYRTDVETAKYFLMINGQKVGYITQPAGDDGGVIVGQRIAGESGASQQRVANRVGYNLKTYYLLNDHLGSPQALLDEGGEVLENMSFGAWGERRPASFDPDGLMTPALFLLSDYSLTHGFTGHEQDDAFGFINMKGRIYDAALGRFMSADPFVQAPNNTQSYNRYSYVLNNPLSYTDPSGYLFSGLKKFLRKHGRTIMAIAVQTFLTVTLGLPPGVVSFATTLASGGSLESAFTNAIFATVSANLANSIGNGNGPIGNFVKGGVKRFGESFRSIAHGVAQGTVSWLQGGKFRSGFVGGFIGHETAGLGKHLGLGSPRDGNPLKTVGRTMLAAAIGGTVSDRTGGKFANGAVSAAFTHLFNAEAYGGHLGRGDAPVWGAVIWEELFSAIPFFGPTIKTGLRSARVAKGASTVSIFKAPQRGKGANQYENGYDTKDFCDGDQCAYFTTDKSLADDYSRHYGEGVIELQIPKNVYDSRMKQHEYSYQGESRMELPVPHSEFDVLNSAGRVWHR